MTDPRSRSPSCSPWRVAFSPNSRFGRIPIRTRTSQATRKRFPRRSRSNRPPSGSAIPRSTVPRSPRGFVTIGIPRAMTTCRRSAPVPQSPTRRSPSSRSRSCSSTRLSSRKRDSIFPPPISRGFRTSATRASSERSLPRVAWFPPLTYRFRRSSSGCTGRISPRMATRRGRLP